MSARPDSAPPAAVTYLHPSRVDRHVASQRYYVMALSEVAKVRVANQPLAARVFSRPEAKVHASFCMSLLREHSPINALRPIAETGASGRYVAEIDGRTVRFTIDCADSGLIRDVEAPSLEWSDVYFKANRWPTLDYDEKVLPLLNSNGWLGPRRLEELRALREHPKDIDVSFVSNVWGGREHNVRLFEQLAGLDARAELKAIFPPGFEPGETEAFKERLRAAGVPVSDRHTPLVDLTQILARSKIVFFRSGKSLCMPWRTIELLALGACIVIDSPPLPEWYAPLRAGVNFVDCGIERPTDTSEAPIEQYAAIAPTVQGLLGDEARMEEIRRSNVEYFERYAAPAPLGAHIVDCLRRHGLGGSGS